MGNNFTAALQNVLASMGWTQNDLAKRLGGVSQGTVSRWVAVGDLPGKATLDALCRVLPPALAADVVSAYLVDLVPPSVTGQVEIVVAGQGATGPKYKYGVAAPGGELSKSLERLGRLALTDPAIAAFLHHLALAAG